MHKNEKQLATGKISKVLFNLALPAVTAQIVNVLYNMVDRMYIGHIPDIGRDALTGIGVCMPLILLISASTALVSMGGSPRASIKMGEGKSDEAERILGNCTSLLVLISVFLTAAFLLFGEWFLLRFGASANTIVHAMGYMRIYAIGTIFVQLSLGLNAFITAQGFAKISMYTVLIGAVSNIILDPIFIFGLKMGVSGAALATIISQGISAIWVVRFLSGPKTVLRIRKENLRLKAKIILPCLALGMAPFIMQSTESLIAVCFNSSLLRYGGDLAVGSMTILTSVMQFSILPLTGIAQGAQPIISYNYGAKNAQRVKEAFQALLKASLIYSVIFWLAVMAVPGLFARIFTQDTQLIEFTMWSLRIYMACGFLLGIQLACQRTLIAIGNAKASLFLAILRKIILLVPLIYMLPHFFENQLFAVFLAEPIADFLAVCATVVLFVRELKKVMRALSVELPDENPVLESKAL
jgi:putative MATE family efflux protein